MALAILNHDKRVPKLELPILILIIIIGFWEIKNKF
tara:strand:- start:33 stop:140 length:108 start_codon:yes stop_codon:yes gene_type:complete